MATLLLGVTGVVGIKAAAEALDDGAEFHLWTGGVKGPWPSVGEEQNVAEANRDCPPAACGVEGEPKGVSFLSVRFRSIEDALEAPNICPECEAAARAFFGFPEPA